MKVQNPTIGVEQHHPRLKAVLCTGELLNKFCIIIDGHHPAPELTGNTAAHTRVDQITNQRRHHPGNRWQLDEFHRQVDLGNSDQPTVDIKLRPLLVTDEYQDGLAFVNFGEGFGSTIERCD